jgi:hypothetical protein
MGPGACLAARKQNGDFNAPKWMIGSERPMAYRRLPDVLTEQAHTIKLQHTLRPFAVAMAGSGEFDPFKD